MNTRNIVVILAMMFFFNNDAQAVERSRSYSWLKTPSNYQQIYVFKYPGLTNSAAPYSVVTRGLYKTGRHGGYYGQRNGGRLPQQ